MTKVPISMNMETCVFPVPDTALNKIKLIEKTIMDPVITYNTGTLSAIMLKSLVYIDIIYSGINRLNGMINALIPKLKNITFLTNVIT